MILSASAISELLYALDWLILLLLRSKLLASGDAAPLCQTDKSIDVIGF
jgi:hypothetical protein